MVIFGSDPWWMTKESTGSLCKVVSYEENYVGEVLKVDRYTGIGYKCISHGFFFLYSFTEVHCVHTIAAIKVPIKNMQWWDL